MASMHEATSDAGASLKRQLSKEAPTDMMELSIHVYNEEVSNLSARICARVLSFSSVNNLLVLNSLNANLQSH